ncbi:MAG: nitroreductase family protein [bacterium]
MLNKEKPVEVIFDIEKCTKCGICAKVCPCEYLLQVESEIITNPDAMFGCIQCGHCMAACPYKAIEIRGESLSKEHLIEFDAQKADYESLYSLLIQRRSARKFKHQPVSQEDIEKILNAASTGAISIPPYEVKIIVINGADKVQKFADDLIDSFKKMTKVFNPFLLWLFKYIMSKNNYKLIKEFVIPLIKTTIEEKQLDHDILFYNAPAVILFYTTEICDKEDAIIAATLAMTAAETLGLGTCVIGSVPPAINQNSKLKAKYGLTKDEKVATAFILGYPEQTFYRGIKRDFKDVKWL